MRSWINGQAADALPLSDRGLHYGDGVFRTMLVWRGEVVWRDEQLAVLRRDAQQLGLAPPPESLLAEELRLAVSGVSRGALKLILTAGDSPRGYARSAAAPCRRIMRLAALPDWPADAWSAGVRVSTLPLRLAAQPALAGAKHLNRLEQVMARAQLPDGCAEGLLRNEQGALQCGIMSNLFWYADGRWRTPAIDNAGVAGLTRQKLMQHPDLSPATCRSTPQEVFSQASRLFLCNALIGIWPVARWNERHYQDSQDEVLGLNELRRSLNHPLLQQGGTECQ